MDKETSQFKRSASPEQKHYSIQTFLIFRSVALSVLITFAILIPAMTALKMATSEKTRNHVYGLFRSWEAFFNILLTILGILAALLSFMFVLCLLMKIYRITLDEGWIRGRNYYGFRREFRLEEITSVDPISSNGVTGWILRTEARGSILVPSQVEKAEELLEEIEKALQKKGLTMFEAEV